MYKKGQKVFVIRMNDRALMDVVPGVVTELIEKGGAMVKIATNFDGTKDTIVIDVPLDCLFASEKMAYQSAAGRTFQTVERHLTQYHALMSLAIGAKS